MKMHAPPHGPEFLTAVYLELEAKEEDL